MTADLTLVEQVAHSNVRIECDRTDGGTVTGTGFFYSLNKEGGSHVPVIVTNRHVIDGSTKGRFVMTLQDVGGGPAMGRVLRFELPDFQLRWRPHPDPSVDLCAMPIAPLLRIAEEQKAELFYVPLDRSFIPSEQEISGMLGNEQVTMVGYPNALWDEVNNLPIFRRGILATSIKADWNGRKEFLIDVACFPGSSGSPVLLLDLGSYQTRNSIKIGGSRLKLLGVLYAGPQQTIQGEIEIVPVPTAKKPISVAEIPINLGIVIKSERLLDFEGEFDV